MHIIYFTLYFSPDNTKQFSPLTVPQLQSVCYKYGMSAFFLIQHSLPCYSMLVVQSLSCAQLLATPWPARFLCPWDLLGKNSGVSRLSFYVTKCYSEKVPWPAYTVGICCSKERIANFSSQEKSIISEHCARLVENYNCRLLFQFLQVLFKILSNIFERTREQHNSTL